MEVYCAMKQPGFKKKLLLSSIAIVLCGGLYRVGPIHAACGSSVSSCKSCHEIQKQKPVSNQGKWHVDHAKLDACDYCHAGQPGATDKARAHQGMVNPFDDPQFNCGSCHPSDWQQKAASYGAK